jgi:hypothetical protein
MSAQVFPPKFCSTQISIEELVAQILMHRRITYTDQQLLRFALLSDETLNEQERILIDRVFYGVRHGLLSIVD